MTFPKVSVILVNWNNFNDTTECLESLRQVTYPNCEVIVVDNGSEGDDAGLIRERFGDHVKVIENDKNYGFAEGCNIGMKDALARGTDYIVLLNNDTLVAPDFLEELVSIAESDGEVGIAGGKIYCYEFPGAIWFAGGFINYWTGKTPIRGRAEKDRGQFEEILAVDWICGCFMFISSKALQTVGTLDNRFFFGWEDVDLCVRAARRGFKILFVPQSKIWHKGFSPGKEKKHAGLPMYYAIRGHFIFMEKHFTKLQRASAMLCSFISLPKVMWDYSHLLGQWKVSIYILQGVFDYFRRRYRTSP
jgi:hypothetical protein